MLNQGESTRLFRELGAGTEPRTPGVLPAEGGARACNRGAELPLAAVGNKTPVILFEVDEGACDLADADRGAVFDGEDGDTA